MGSVCAERIIGEQDVTLVLGIGAERGVAHGAWRRPYHIANHPHGFAAGEGHAADVRYRVGTFLRAFASAGNGDRLFRIV